jgi:hypothetical protein
VDQATDPEARDLVSGSALEEARAAGELVVAEPGGAGVLVRLELAPACGTPARPAAAVALGRVAEAERVVVGAVPVAEAGPAAQVAVGTEVVEEQERAAEAEGLEPAAVAVQERALVVAPEAAAQVGVGTEVLEERERAAEAEGLGPAEELEVQAGKAQRRENG